MPGPTSFKALTSLCLFMLFFSLYGCHQETASSTPSPDYGTDSDSARYYFLKGWEEILDNGRWTESELAFRKAVTFDHDWLLGQSLVGRITQNLEERERLYEQLEANKEQASPDELLLLEVNLLSLKAANNRGRGISNTPEFNTMRRQLAEKNFGAFARKYPEDDYFRAEYIEFLHANHGAKTALDSIPLLTNERQKKLLFFISYAGNLHLELEEVDEAKERLSRLQNTIQDSSYLSAKMLEVLILEKEGKILIAKDLIDRIVASDPKHLIAVGTQARINRKLTSSEPPNQ